MSVLDYGPILGSNLAPLIRANTVQLPRVDLQPLAKRGPSEGWKRCYFIKVGVGGCLGLIRLCSEGSRGG